MVNVLDGIVDLICFAEICNRLATRFDHAIIVDDGSWRPEFCVQRRNVPVVVEIGRQASIASGH
jgi:hypothetical protein